MSHKYAHVAKHATWILHVATTPAHVERPLQWVLHVATTPAPVEYPLQLEPHAHVETHFPCTCPLAHAIDDVSSLEKYFF